MGGIRVHTVTYIIETFSIIIYYGQALPETYTQMLNELSRVTNTRLEGNEQFANIFLGGQINQKRRNLDSNLKIR